MPVITSGEPYADVVDVEERWRTLANDEAARAQSLLADATLLVNAEFKALPGLVAASGVPPEATMVVAHMVRRALVAPAEGYSSDAPGAVGVASYAQVGGNLYLTSSDRALLASVLGIGQGWRAPAYTVSLGG